MLQAPWPRRPSGNEAIVADEGSFSFADVESAANRVGTALLGTAADLSESRVAFLVPPGFRYTALLLGTWVAGGIAVPLATSHPGPELRYVVEDADASVIICSSEYTDILAPIAAARGATIIDADEVVFGHTGTKPLPLVERKRRGLILYTSGSTGSAKGVVWSHDAVEAQLRTLSSTWRWSADDRALLVLPLHHVHGLINVLASSLWNGATCEMLARFDAGTTLERLASGDITVFMAVPTIYRRLIAAWEDLDSAARARVSAAMSGLRLMISGSAALPVPTLDRWREISGHTLLERYGMTEVGMALSNPYDGPRAPGTVGVPFPEVEVRLAGEDGGPVAEGEQGEIEVKGPSVFAEYWRRPDTTAASFRDGWFRTGDIAVANGGIYRILGRRSVDIIKSGAEKISALEIEDVLRTHAAVRDCAVIGIEDPEWGERVAVAIVAAGRKAPGLSELREFARERLAPHKLPRQLIVLEDLPRNALGKVVKPRLKELFDDPAAPDC